MIDFKTETHFGKTFLYGKLPYISAQVEACKWTDCRNFINNVSLDDSGVDYFNATINKTFVGKYKTKEGAKLAIINKLKETGHILLED